MLRVVKVLLLKSEKLSKPVFQTQAVFQTQGYCMPYVLKYKRVGKDSDWQTAGGHFTTKADALEYACDMGNGGRVQTKITKIATPGYAKAPRYNRED
jgi:hypothetical protein